MDVIAGAMMKPRFYIPPGAAAHRCTEVMQASMDAR